MGEPTDAVEAFSLRSFDAIFRAFSIATRQNLLHLLPLQKSWTWNNGSWEDDYPLPRGDELHFHDCWRNCIAIPFERKKPILVSELHYGSEIRLKTDMSGLQMGFSLQRTVDQVVVDLNMGGNRFWKHAPSEASHLNLHPKRYLRNHWWSNIVHVVFEGSMFNMCLIGKHAKKCAKALGCYR